MNDEYRKFKGNSVSDKEFALIKALRRRKGAYAARRAAEQAQREAESRYLEAKAEHTAADYAYGESVMEYLEYLEG